MGGLIVAIPCRDTVAFRFFESMISLRVPDGTHWTGVSGTLSYVTRNELARAVLEGGYDRVLWLQGDVAFSPDLAERLAADLDAGLEYVSALCFTQGGGQVLPDAYSEVGWQDDGAGGKVLCATRFEEYPRDSLFRVAGTSLSAVMMSADAIRRVGEAFGAPFDPVPSTADESLSFCARLTELGIAMYCDSRVALGRVGGELIGDRPYE
ncbi:MAG: hypothetical protein IJ087_12150 [Eggerthellaceae bacterium]|nr:hypothetical protein [Eggerthellaceae bacterium]